jgi:hypothetical protein
MHLNGLTTINDVLFYIRLFTKIKTHGTYSITDIMCYSALKNHLFSP